MCFRPSCRASRKPVCAPSRSRTPPPPEGTIISASAPSIGFVGAGRLGTALAWALARRGASVVAAASRSTASARALAAGIPGCRALEGAQQVADACDLVFLTVNDAAIAPAAAGLRWSPRVSVVHCSGATPVDALASAAQQGAPTGGFHPLQTFADPEAAIRSLPGCTIAVEADEPLRAALESLATRLQCRVIRLPAGARARYHASGAYASQLLNVMLREAGRIWESFGGTEAEAVAALAPLARGTLAAIESTGVAAAMPGPISRGDLAVVRAHTEALGAVDPAIGALYCELSLRAVPLAVERGSIGPERAAEFETLLREARRRLQRGASAR